jgi:hypothetical protein
MSDHCPLILGLEDGVISKKCFHFESYWMKLPGFHEAVERSWNELDRASLSLERLSIKLKRLMRALQSWNSKQVGHVKTQLALAREVLHRLEIAQDNRLLSSDEDWLRIELKRHCLVLASLERTIATLRSRVCHLKDGDANTSLFHKKKKAIPKLMSGGHLVTTQEEKQNVMFEFYEGLIGTALPCTSTLNLQQFHNQIVDLIEMDNPITEEEVCDTIKSLPADRAPEPDGYIGRFYKACWQLIKVDFMAAIITLQQGNAQKLELLNSTSLTLIPKKEEALSPADFGPISLSLIDWPKN